MKPVNKIQKILMDDFCLRQFDKTKSSSYINYDPSEFARIINEFYVNNKERKHEVQAPTDHHKRHEKGNKQKVNKNSHH